MGRGLGAGAAGTAALAGVASGAEAASCACAKAENPAAVSSRAIRGRRGAETVRATRLMGIRSFLTISQEFGEARIAEGGGRQVVAEQRGIDLGGRDDLLVDLAPLHQQQAGQQG